MKSPRDPVNLLGNGVEGEAGRWGGGGRGELMEPRLSNEISVMNILFRQEQKAIYKRQERLVEGTASGESFLWKVAAREKTTWKATQGCMRGRWHRTDMFSLSSCVFPCDGSRSFFFGGGLLLPVPTRTINHYDSTEFFVCLSELRVRITQDSHPSAPNLRPQSPQGRCGETPEPQADDRTTQGHHLGPGGQTRHAFILKVMRIEAAKPKKADGLGMES